MSEGSPMSETGTDVPPGIDAEAVTAWLTARVDKLAVAVTQEAPFKLSIVQPKVPLVQGGSMP